MWEIKLNKQHKSNCASHEQEYVVSLIEMNVDVMSDYLLKFIMF